MLHQLLVVVYFYLIELKGVVEDGVLSNMWESVAIRGRWQFEILLFHMSIRRLHPKTGGDKEEATSG
jgi:hypothetical protein